MRRPWQSPDRHEADTATLGDRMKEKRETKVPVHVDFLRLKNPAVNCFLEEKCHTKVFVENRRSRFGNFFDKQK